MGNNDSLRLELDFEKNSNDLKIAVDIYKKILSTAIEQTRNDLQSFDGALVSSDFEGITEISHRLKGDYDNMRIQQLASIAREIERNSKEGQDKERIAHYIYEFKNLFSQLESSMKNASQ